MRFSEYSHESTFLQEIEFIKDGSFNFEELDAFSNALKLAGASEGTEKSPRKNQRRSSSRRGTSFDASQRSALEKSVSALEDMGVRVYGYDEPHEYSKNGVISWDNIAGYDQQKQYVRMISHFWYIISDDHINITCFSNSFLTSISKLFNFVSSYSCKVSRCGDC